MSDVPLVEETKPDKEELKLAKSLVDSMSTSLDKIELEDHYHAALREMIQAKIEGKEIITVEEEEQPVVDIMQALKQSIEQAKTQKKPMVKATGKKPAAKRKTAKKKTQTKAKAKKRRTA